jgi:osmoprotectant transport system ATP-binding protein
LITLKDVTKRFPGSETPAVDRLSLDIKEGEVVSLVGPSGCGKTTTLKMINRLVEPSSGSIVVNGVEVLHQDPVKLRRDIGYVIQSIGLMPHRTIAQNIGTVPKLVGWEKKKIDLRIEELVAIFELDRELLPRYPAELSGGQRQRVGVARALAVDPPVMLMDEPFGAVDPIVRTRLQDQFLTIQRTLKKTIVFVTHDIDEAIKMSDRITILNRGGVIEQFASPEEILREPANEFVKQFVGAERGLKRLSLIRVADIGVEEGPVVSSEAGADEAMRVIEKFGFDWTSVVEGSQLLGWLDENSLKGKSNVSEVEPRKFAAYVTPESSLRQALDSIVSSRTRVAVVLGQGQEYFGILTLEHIAKEIIT